MMLKATIQNLQPRVRCVRFDLQESPSSINDGKGWPAEEQVAFLQEMGFNQLQEHTTNLCSIRRVQEPTTAKQTSVEVWKGVQLWLDK